MKWQESEISRNWETERIVRIRVYLKISDSLGRKEVSETYENGLGFIRHFLTLFLCEWKWNDGWDIFMWHFFFFLCLFVCLETSPRSFEWITNFLNNYDWLIFIWERLRTRHLFGEYFYDKFEVIVK